MTIYRFKRTDASPWEFAADAPRQYAELTTVAPETVARVAAYTDADQSWALHTQVCDDQQERYDCRSCRTHNDERYAAKHAMEADPAAVEFFASDHQRDERRRWSREVFRPLADSQAHLDY